MKKKLVQLILLLSLFVPNVWAQEPIDGPWLWLFVPNVRPDKADKLDNLESNIRPTISTGSEVYINFRNKTGNPVHLYWIDQKTSLIYYGEIEADQEFEQHTFVGHVWLITDIDSNHIGIYEAKQENERKHNIKSTKGK